MKSTTTTPYLLELHFKRPLISDMKKLTSCTDVNQYIRENIDIGLINHKEFFWVILLTQSHYVIGVKEISSGTTNSTTVSFKEIAQVAFLANACACVIVHNHPSGSLTPSESDKLITKKAKKVLNLIDVSIIDHIIVTEESYYSFAKDNLII